MPAGVATGGAAFGERRDTTQPGMSIRDYFAAKAMAALAVHTINFDNANGEIQDEDAAAVARNAYVLADAMLEARK